MLRFEIKKVMSKPLNKAALLLLALAAVGVALLAIRDVTYVDDQGNTKYGPAAIRALREEKNQWAGELTPEVIVQVLEENARINASPQAKSEDVQEQNQVFSRKQQFSDIREMINEAYGELDAYDYYLADRIPAEDGSDFYERRLEGLEKWLSSGEGSTYTEAEKEYLRTKFREAETPFHYQCADGWKALLDSAYMNTLLMITVIVTAFLVSGIFSDEFNLKADSIFFSTRMGRGRAVWAKVGAGMLLTTGIYWGAVLLYSLLVLAVVGPGGGSCAVQTGFGNWASIYNITYFQDFLITVGGGYVGTLFIILVGLLVSARSHSAIMAVAVPFALTCFPPFLGRITALEKLMLLFPDQLLMINQSLNVRKTCLYQIGGRIFGSSQVLAVLYLVLICAAVPALFVLYRRSQIR